MSLSTKLAAALVAFGAMVGGTPASAIDLYFAVQPSGYVHTGTGGYDDRHWARERSGISYRELRRALRHQGYRLVDIMDRGRRTYTVMAENHRGREYILRVSAISGNVLSAQPIRRWAGRGGWGDRDWRPGDRERCWLPEGCY